MTPIASSAERVEPMGQPATPAASPVVDDVDSTLAGDPAGAYAAMDDRTRSSYRETIALLARRARRSEVEVAAAALTLARAAAGSDDVTASHRRHVGYYLVDRGRTRLAAAIGVRGPLGWRLREVREGALLAAYLGFVIGASVLLAWGLMSWGPPTSPAWVWLALGAAGTVSATWLSMFVATWLVRFLFPPQRLPRMDLSGGIPAEWETLVVVPCKLTSIAAIDTLACGLERVALGNRGDHVGFGLVTDFPDAREARLPEDAAALAHAQARIDELNTRHGGGFVWLHRPRRWNARDQVWMGWERKRGKLEDLNAYLVEGADRFELVTGDVARLRAIRFIITVDEDMGLQWGTVRRLVAVMAHPLNRPCFDPVTGRVVAGHGVLQPIMRPDDKPGTTRYERVFQRLRGWAAPDPDDVPVRWDVYQDLLGQGTFHGKGIYDLAAFHRALHERFPDNQILSHDMLEGSVARSGFINDVQLLEDLPTTYLANMARHHRWMRGDWQLAPYLRRTVRNARGERVRNPISAVGSWRVIDSMRRMFLSPAMLVSFAGGWFVSPWPGRWTLFLFAFPVVPVFANRLLELSSSARSSRPPARASLSTRLAATAMQLAFMVHETYVTLDAVVRATTRMWITRRRLLQWTPFKLSNTGRERGLWAHYRAMWESPLFAAVIGGWLAWARPDAVPIAAPLLATWFAAPALAWWMSRRDRGEAR